ncbi:MAG: YybH family protein [Gammaproteobacteria bacterium]|nr:nuclear transport factor 2 family protein [Gammaproteobacteria bacterium]
MSDIEFATPQEAEQAFYQAFERADLPAMMSVWADLPNTVCIHPLGPRHQGRTQIEASWREILSAGLRLRFTITETQYTQDALLAVHVVQENIQATGESGRRTPILSTNIYQLMDSGWRMILHHASPAPRAAEHGRSPSLH